MDSKKNHALRKKLDDKIISLVKPINMTNAEYCITCNIEDFEPSVENGSYLHWLVTSNGDADIIEKVHLALVHALEKKYLLDITNDEQMSYFYDAIVDICIKDKEWTGQIVEAVLKSYEGTEVFNLCKRLNKAIGYTSVKYFN